MASFEKGRPPPQKFDAAGPVVRQVAWRCVRLVREAFGKPNSVGWLGIANGDSALAR